MAVRCVFGLAEEAPAENADGVDLEPDITRVADAERARSRLSRVLCPLNAGFNAEVRARSTLSQHHRNPWPRQ